MDICVGKVTHYFDKICVAVLEMTGDLKVGDRICILGRITDFEQPVGSMEIDHQPVSSVGAGQEVALKVIEPVRPGDSIYRVTAD